MARDATSRRTWLKSAAVGGLAGLAGCSSGDGSDGASQTTPSEDLGEEVRTLELTGYASGDSPLDYEVMELVSGRLEEQLGLSIELNPMPFTAQVGYVTRDREFDIWSQPMQPLSFRYDPHFWVYQQFHSSQQDVGQYNIYGHEDDEYDEAAAEQMRLPKTDPRKEAVDRCQELMVEKQVQSVFLTGYSVEVYNSNRIDPSVFVEGGPRGTSKHVLTQIETENDEYVSGSKTGDSTHNPLNMQTGNMGHVHTIHDSLLFINEAGDEYVPWAAESYEIVDNTTFRATLRDDLMFHDGVPVTPEDVKFSFEFQSENGMMTTYLGDLDTVEILDDRSVEMRLERPFAPFVANGLGYTPILPKHIWEKVPDDVDAESATDWEPAPEDKIGSGPFEFVEWEQDEQMVYESFDDHHMSPSIDRFVRIIGPANTLHDRLETESLDHVLTQPGPSTVDRLTDNDNMASHIPANHGLEGVFHYNLNKPPLDDKALRRGIAYAIPREDVRDIIYEGRVETETSIISQDNSLWHNDDVEDISYDPEQARSILSDGGYGWDSDGTLHHLEES